jgi:hypothetical protein
MSKSTALHLQVVYCVAVILACKSGSETSYHNCGERMFPDIGSWLLLRAAMLSCISTYAVSLRNKTLSGEKAVDTRLGTAM